MAYENHIPPLSTINQGTRDFDFIPITELKEFDEKLNEIVKKISSINTSEASDVNSIAYKLKERFNNGSDILCFLPQLQKKAERTGKSCYLSTHASTSRHTSSRFNS